MSSAERDDAWRDSAACRGTSPQLYFGTRINEVADAKKVCKGCKVVGDCLDYALDRPEEFGVWGGASERERRRMRRRRIPLQVELPQAVDVMPPPPKNLFKGPPRPSGT
jgi:WhiB family redox-sensing transcriptional regulator